MTDRIAENFEKFHAENPHVFEMFSRFAIEMWLRREHGSASLIFERMRWEFMLDTGHDAPRLNNNYRALYAREWEGRNPNRRGFFRKRIRRANTIDSTAFDKTED